jgi:hypothetical protein
MLRHLLRYALLVVAFTLTSFGLMQWQSAHFDTHAVWPFAPTMTLHPLHWLLLGLVMIPLSLWEIFLLEPRIDDDGR